jgi:PiT family inorganic phosphate transporter
VDFREIKKIEKATRRGRGEQFRLGFGVLFLAGATIYALSLPIGQGTGHILLAIAAAIGAYMAMNIGANDVANNVGPAVGSKAITLGGALVIAAVCEAAGALLAGGDVVGTIRSGIIDPGGLPAGDAFVWLMMAALLASALWLNFATAMGAPVSTTHAIVGALIGAGAAAAGFEVVHWQKMGEIVASWVISPALGGIFAAIFLYFIKRRITYQADMGQAAARIVPWLVAAMVWVFSAYLLLKGFSKLWKVPFWGGVALGLIPALPVQRILAWRFRANPIEDTKEGVNQLFTVPLIFAAALLSFAHGANDVANAIGPLAAITDALATHVGQISEKAAIPLWVMAIGAIGISLGLALYGPKVIRTVGSEITELDKMRAFCIALSAAFTVIVASHLGLPVSSTHIAVGGVFGVGFLREYLKANYARIEDEIRAHHPEDDHNAIDSFLADFKRASVDEKKRLLAELKLKSRLSLDPANLSKPERKGLKKIYRRELVKRSQLYKIAAAWVVTVPASAIMAAMLFYMLRGIMVGSS